MRLPRAILPVSSATRRICSETVYAKVQVSARPKAAMDGYGISSKATRNSSPLNPSKFSIRSQGSSTSRAPQAALRSGEAIYLSTGSPVPPGVNAIARVEEARRTGRRIEITRPIPLGRDIESGGEDFKIGARLLGDGERVSPASVSLLMAAGRRKVTVYRTARVGIVSVGDELADVTAPKSGNGPVNNYAHLVAGYTSELGGDPALLGIARGGPEELSRLIRRSIGHLDLLVTIGRASVGVSDYVSEAISLIPGAEILFHGLNMLLARPTGLAVVREKPVCILPAKAVSTAMSFLLVAAPLLSLMNGMSVDSRPQVIPAVASSAVTNKHSVEALILVALRSEAAHIEASPLRWGSNLSSELAKASGLVRLSAGQRVEKGGTLRVSLLPGPILLGADGD